MFVELRLRIISTLEVKLWRGPGHSRYHYQLPSPQSSSLSRSILLLLSGFLPSHGPEGQQERAEEMPGGYSGLLGDSVHPELYPLPLRKVSQNWDEARPPEGKEEK